MYGIYKGKKCRVAKISTFYRVISSEKEEGFEEVSNIFIAEYDKGQLNVVTY